MAWPEEDLWKQICSGYHYEYKKGWAVLPKGPLLDRACVDYCIQEVRHKAEYSKRTGVIPTSDATFSVAKSDTIVPESLRVSLREAFACLQSDQASRPDWHPNTNETVRDLVHPSMYPLVYGRTLILEDEVVGVDGAVDKWAGKGKVIPGRGENPELDEMEVLEKYGRRRHEKGAHGLCDSGVVPGRYWSETYQWLPANLEFTDGGGVRFTSYINGLHPVKCQDIYRTVENLVEKSLPMWDQCLVRGERSWIMARAGQPRIIHSNPDDENPRNWTPRDEDSESDPEYPDPQALGSSPINYDADPTQTLRELFKDTGLQIIVKMASIELTPEKPEFPPGGWYVEGMMNERIPGTALYYLDSDNVTESHLEFEAHTDAYLQDDPRFKVSQDGYHWMQSVYGANFGSSNSSGAQQKYRSVLTPQGRLLAFPNLFQHRVSGFRLADPTKPGHRRFIALWLVDPTMRIINTGMVPPQQAEWWADGGERTQVRTGGGKLPAEALEVARTEFQVGDHLPMTRKEAEEHRLKLMEERSGFQETIGGDWYQACYNFCEH